MFESVAAGFATAVAAFTLLSAYTGLVQKFDKLEAGQRALEIGQQENKSELKELRGDVTIVGCISVGGFVFVLIVMMKQPKDV